MLLTGIPTVWYHGFGEQFWPRVADVGTNVLLSWLLANAALGDYYSSRTHRLVVGALGVWNVLVMGQMILEGPDHLSGRVLAFGASNGFTLRQLTLVANGLLATVLLYLHYRCIPPAARPLLHVQTVWFLIGMAFASNNSHSVGFNLLAYHAVWHLIAGFGFVILWAFNHVRFSATQTLRSLSVKHR